MCCFKSAIVVQDLREKYGYRICLSPWTESHSEIETLFNLREGKSLKFAKVEFSPDDMAFAYQTERYKLKIDEDRTPEWFDDEMRENVTAEMRDYIRSIIVSGDVDLLIGGQFIVAPGAKISSCHSMVINAICGGTISDIRGGTISAIWGGTISAIRGGTISAIRGGTISDIRGGTISAIRGGTISDISGGTISDIKENFDDYGSIKTISKSANVTDNRQRNKSRSTKI